MLNATFSNISSITWRPVLEVEEAVSDEQRQTLEHVKKRKRERERETNEKSMKLATYTYTYILYICDC